MLYAKRHGCDAIGLRYYINTRLMNVHTAVQDTGYISADSAVLAFELNLQLANSEEIFSRVACDDSLPFRWIYEQRSARPLLLWLRRSYVPITKL